MFGCFHFQDLISASLRLAVPSRFDAVTATVPTQEIEPIHLVHEVAGVILLPGAGLSAHQFRRGPDRRQRVADVVRHRRGNFTDGREALVAGDAALLLARVRLVGVVVMFMWSIRAGIAWQESRYSLHKEASRLVYPPLQGEALSRRSHFQDLISASRGAATS